MTTLDWNVSYTILYYVKEHFYILVSSFERESCEYPNFPILLGWFRKKGHYLQLVSMMDKQGFGVRMVRLALIYLLSVYISSKNKPSWKICLLDISIALSDMTITPAMLGLYVSKKTLEGYQTCGNILYSHCYFGVKIQAYIDLVVGLTTSGVELGKNMLISENQLWCIFLFLLSSGCQPQGRPLLIICNQVKFVFGKNV